MNLKSLHLVIPGLLIVVLCSLIIYTEIIFFNKCSPSEVKNIEEIKKNDLRKINDSEMFPLNYDPLKEKIENLLNTGFSIGRIWFDFPTSSIKLIFYFTGRVGMLDPTKYDYPYFKLECTLFRKSNTFKFKNSNELKLFNNKNFLQFDEFNYLRDLKVEEDIYIREKEPFNSKVGEYYSIFDIKRYAKKSDFDVFGVGRVKDCPSEEPKYIILKKGEKEVERFLLHLGPAFGAPLARYERIL